MGNTIKRSAEVTKVSETVTAIKIKFSIKDFVSKCEQIRRKLFVLLYYYITRVSKKGKVELDCT